MSNEKTAGEDERVVQARIQLLSAVSTAEAAIQEVESIASFAAKGSPSDANYLGELLSQKWDAVSIAANGAAHAVRNFMQTVSVVKDEIARQNEKVAA